MLSNGYAQYIKGIINLVRSLNIKSLHTMNAMNSFLKAGGEVIGTDPTAYRYYLHLNGEYYQGTTGLFDDPELKTYSPDSETVVTLTKDLLVTHIKLHGRLKRRDTLYTTLTEKYPDSILLINGIINPIDINVAIAANDYEILQYDDRYVYIGETNLIPKLQIWVNNFMSRWDVTGYRLCDKLYPAGLLGLLAINMVSAITNIRLENCGTDYAHEYHIWNYLGGWFELDKYKANITHRQALFLYRNIRYIVNNGGTKEILTMLDDNLVKQFGLTLNQFDLHRSIDSALINLQSNFLDSLEAEAIVTKKLYGNLTTDVNSLQQSTPEVLVQRMIDQGEFNPRNIKEDVKEAKTRINGAIVSKVPTGVLECIPEGSTSTVIVHKDTVRVANWLYLASIDKINYTFVLTIPGNNVFDFTLTAKDAAVMLLYASARIFGLEGTDVPQPVVSNINKIPNDTETSLRGLVENSLLKNGELWDHYEDILDTVLLPRDVDTLADYVTYSNALIDCKIMQWIIPFVSYTALGRGQLKGLINKFNASHKCIFTDAVLYEDFFNDIGVDLSTFSTESLRYLANTILINFIGIEPENMLDNSLNKNIIAILRVLSSYTINIIDNNQLDPPMPIDWAFSVPSVEYLEIKELHYLEMLGYADTIINCNVRSDVSGTVLQEHIVSEHVIAVINFGTRYYPSLITNYYAPISSGGSYIEGIVSSESGQGQIKAFVNIRTDLTSGTESAQTQITVTLYTDIPVVNDQTVTIEVSGADVTLDDYNISLLTVPIYDGTNETNITFTVLDDSLVEDTEIATVAIMAISGGLRLGNDIAKNITIVSDDVNLITVNLSVDHSIVSESSSTGNDFHAAVCKLTASGPVVGNQTATIVITGDVTTDDYFLSGTTFTIQNGTTISNEITIYIVNDIVVENTELVTVGISNLTSGISLGNTTVQHVSVLDDDFIPSVELTLSKYTATEAAGDNISVIVTASSAVINDETVNVNVTGVGITGGDYTIASGSIQISSGTTVGTTTLTVLDDIIVEGTETAIVTISSPTNGIVLGSTVTQNIAITDNDSVVLPKVTLALSMYTVSETP